jgi:hypothetical protein
VFIKVPIILVILQHCIYFPHSFLKVLEYKRFLKIFFSLTICSMGVGGRTDRRMDVAQQLQT